MSAWISVKERLPELRVAVLLYRDCYQTVVAWYSNSGNWVNDDNNYPLGPGVTHWQPLPEPPNE